ncbi:unnamed protein product [Rhizopus stolonifer]
MACLSVCTAALKTTKKQLGNCRWLVLFSPLKFKMCMFAMDLPNRYVCKLKETKTASFMGDEESLGCEFTKVYKLLWKAKAIVLNTEKMVNDYVGLLEMDFDGDFIDRISF